MSFFCQEEHGSCRWYMVHLPGGRYRVNISKTGSQTNLWEPARYHLVAAYTKITQSLIGAYRERSMLKQTRIELGGWLIDLIFISVARNDRVWFTHM